MWFRNIFRTEPGHKGGRSSEDAEGGSGELLPAQALRQLDHLRLNTARWLPGKPAGGRPSRRRKPSYDFIDHRRYVPGDDARYIDWKASGRQEHIFIRQGEQPKDAPVYLLVDCSKSMMWGEPPKREAELRLAAALGYMALAHGDRLSVLPFAGRLLPPFGPVSGKGQVPALLNYLHGLNFTGRSDLKPVLKYLSARAASGGMLVVLSDFLDVDGTAELVGRLREPAWDVVLLQMLHPEEVEPRQRGDFEMIDSESGQRANYDLNARALEGYAKHLSEAQAALDRLCDANNAFFGTLRTDWPLDTGLLPKLYALQVVRPV